jgi:CRISPR-associated protein Csd1
MILQALDAYYKRLLDDPEQNVAVYGFSRESIHCEVLLRRDGTFEMRNIQSIIGNKRIAQRILVPEPAKDRRGLKIVPQYMWDNTGYALGLDLKGNPERSRLQFESFRKIHNEILCNIDDEGVVLFLNFINSWNPDQNLAVGNFEEIIGSNIVFRIDGDCQFLHERIAIRRAWLEYLSRSNKKHKGRCLVSNRLRNISRLHPIIKGLFKQKKAGPLVSFNEKAYESYNKEQSYNSPVSEESSFAYATALNHMLSPESSQKLQMGDSTAVFWSEKPTKIEAFFAAAMGGAVGENTTDAHDTALITDLRNLLIMLRKGGGKPSWDVAPDTPFYILGLAPNAARISVRFWHASTVEGIMRMLAEHYQDLELEPRYENEPKYPGIFRLLLETVPARKKADGRIERKADDIQPLLGGELVRAILTGAEYPRSLLSKIIGRFRADGEVSYLRAALLKAQFSRRARLGKPSKEVSVSLDPSNTNVGYRLGRLFAVLEKAQQDALPGINATIKDRFYGAASATPASVFPRLIRMAQHYISKAEFGVISDRRMGDILETLPEFPRHMDLDGQAMFALGYYHQRNDIWRKKTNVSANSSES